MKYYVGIDLGGTNIVAGVVDENYKIISKVSVPTNAPKSCEEICRSMADVAIQAIKKAELSRADIAWIGVGIPGHVNKKNGEVLVAVNLGLENAPIVSTLSRMCLLPVYIENDANVAAYGEFIAGCGKKAKSLVAITIGTGIGSGIIIDGKIYPGAYGGGAEWGHMVIHSGGRQCSCGRKGCMEAYVSASALISIARERVAQNPNSQILKIAKMPENITAKVVFDAAHMEDALALEILNAYYDDMACGLANIINGLQPEILCIGGGVSAQGEYLLSPIRTRVEQEIISKNSPKNTKIVAAELGNDAGIIGAALLGQLE